MRDCVATPPDEIACVQLLFLREALNDQTPSLDFHTNDVSAKPIVGAAIPYIESTTRERRAFFGVEAEGTGAIVIEADNWECAVAHYVHLGELTGWKGNTALGIVAAGAADFTVARVELFFSECLFRIAMRSLRHQPPRWDTSLDALPSDQGQSFEGMPHEGNRGALIRALLDFSALRLDNARTLSFDPPQRVVAAFESGYAALLAIAHHTEMAAPTEHWNRQTLERTARAAGLEEQDIDLWLRLLRWIVAERHENPATPPVSMPAAIRWAERVRALRSS